MTGTTGELSAQQVESGLAAAVGVLAGVGGSLHRLNGEALGAAFASVQELRRLADAASVALLSEAMERGECGGAATDPREWVVAHRDAGSAPVEPGEVSRLVTVARGVNASPVRKPLRDSVIDGSVSIAKAQVCLAEMNRLEHRLTEHAVPIVWQAFADLASIDRVRVLKNLKPALLAKYGADDELQRDHDKAATFVSLSAPVRDGALFHYALTLDPVGHATLEAALGPLSAPAPGGNGERDTRPASRRRGEALVTLVGRAVAAADSLPSISKTQLLVTMSLQDLESRLARAGVDVFGRGVFGGGEAAKRINNPGNAGNSTGTGPTGEGSTGSGSTGTGPTGEGSTGGSAGALCGVAATTGAGEVLGSTAGGTLLAPGEVRRLACDAQVTPVVLGSAGQILEYGLSSRPFPPGLIKGLLLRDRECTFPGCTRPGTWADAHHLIHWADGGPSNLTNGALLCGQHHARVHSDRLYGWVEDTPDSTHFGHVCWDLTPLNYDRFLERREQDRCRRAMERDRE